MSKIRETQANNRLQNNTSKFKKLERHFSDKVIRTLDYEDLIKIQKRNLTIVFWDIENSSAMSDMLMSSRYRVHRIGAGMVQCYLKGYF